MQLNACTGDVYVTLEFAITRIPLPLYKHARRLNGVIIFLVSLLVGNPVEYKSVYKMN